MTSMVVGFAPRLYNINWNGQETKRIRPNSNERQKEKLLKKNGKYFVAPVYDGEDFKKLFKRLASMGAGRPVDSDGFPEGPWTPELLAEEISRVSSDPNGVDIRTVQLWFQDNDKGISAGNIRWLARIFGCDDQKATSDWQVALSAAQAGLSGRRRKRRMSVHGSTLSTTGDIGSNIEVAAVGSENSQSLATRTESQFNGRSSLNLPAIVWTGATALGFFSYLIGAHDITYTPVPGLDKQVGLLWSPNWTVEGLILLPLFLLTVSGTLAFWKNEGRPLLTSGLAGMHQAPSWIEKVESYSLAYWAILVTCIVNICFLQWYGTYYRAFFHEQMGDHMVDWLLLTLERPEIVSKDAAVAASVFAFLYSSLIYWFYFSGLLLVYTVASDYCDVCGYDTSDRFDQWGALDAGVAISIGAFRGAIFGLLIAVCIKVNAAYLMSDGTNIVAWLIDDALTIVGVVDTPLGWIRQGGLPFFTSFMLVLITCFVFFCCLAQVRMSFARMFDPVPSSGVSDNRELAAAVRKARRSQAFLAGVVVQLVVGFLSIGHVWGFSVLLSISVVIALGSLWWWAGLPKSMRHQLSAAR